jgi:hypothetical protein
MITDRAAMLDGINEIAAKKMAEWLNASKLDLRRPLNTFGLSTWKALAAVAWSTYEIELSKREFVQADDQDQLDLMI